MCPVLRHPAVGLMGELGEAERALLCPYHFWAVTQLCSCLTQLVSPAGTAEPATTAGLTRGGAPEEEDCGEEGGEEETHGLLIYFRST